MNYVCPNPQCGGKLEVGETYYRGGTPFNCPKCSSTSTIPLYCPTCCPPTVKDKTYLQTPSGFLGGTEVPCPKGHKFTVHVLTDEVHARLGLWGTEIGRYYQSDRIKSLSDAKLKKSVEGGYCAGVVLDWIRRALLGGKLGFAEDKDRQNLRAATAQVTQSPEKVDLYRKQKLESLKAGVATKKNTLSAEARQKLDKAGKDLQHIVDLIDQKTGLSLAQRREYYDKAQKQYDEQVAEINADSQLNKGKLDAALHKWTNKSNMEQYWAEFVRVMDERLAQDRAKKPNKAGPSKCRFTDLTIVKSVDKQEFPGIAALIDELIHEPEFQGNCAASLGVTPPEAGATGHAVGILRRNTGEEYHLFDPNFGTYKIPATKLREAVVYIFKTAYPNLPTGNKADNKPYEVGGKVKGDYVIFEGQLQKVACPTPSLQPITQVLPQKAQVLAPMVSQPKVQASAAKAGGTQVTGQKAPVTNPVTPKPGSKVSDMINKFNKGQ